MERAKGGGPSAGAGEGPAGQVADLVQVHRDPSAQLFIHVEGKSAYNDLRTTYMLRTLAKKS